MHNIADGAGSGPLRRFHELSLGGQLLLWAARHWMQAFEADRPVRHCVWQSFAVADLQPAWVHLSDILATVAFRELKPAAFRHPSSVRLSVGERQLIAVFASIDAGDNSLAFAQLNSIAVPSVARSLVVAASDLVAAMHAAGHRVRYVDTMPGNSACDAGERKGLPATCH